MVTSRQQEHERLSTLTPAQRYTEAEELIALARRRLAVAVARETAGSTRNRDGSAVVGPRR